MSTSGVWSPNEIRQRILGSNNTVGNWSPNQIRERELDGTWPLSSDAPLDMVLMKPTSVVVTSGSATINRNGSVSFTATPSLSLNGVFTASFNNYMIKIRSFVASGGAFISARFRASNTNDTTPNYNYQFLIADSNSVTASTASSQTNGFWGVTFSNPVSGAVSYVYGPQLAQQTVVRVVGQESLNSGTLRDIAWSNTTSTSYDGLTMYHDTIAMTGSISVYGLKGA